MRVDTGPFLLTTDNLLQGLTHCLIAADHGTAVREVRLSGAEGHLRGLCPGGFRYSLLTSWAGPT